MKNEMRPKDSGLYVDSIFKSRNQESADEWLKFATLKVNQYQLVDFVRLYRPGFSLPKKLYDPIRGSYNINWRLEFEDGLSVMIHVPIPHLVAFPDEKIRAEAAAMMLIRDNTTIPVPEVYGWCTADQNLTGYGPLIVMEYIDFTKCLADVIQDRLDAAGSNGARKSVTDQPLLKAYRQMANIMLQLSTIDGSAIGFPSIPKDITHEPLGSLSPAKVHISPQHTHRPQSRISKVCRRPISQSTSDMVFAGGIPTSILPPLNKPYKTSNEYYQAMADMHLAHLALQHNDAVTSPPDGREKYVARQLFRKLAREGRLTKNDENTSTAAPGQYEEVFKLWCDDMRPTNVLLDDKDDVVGVIDWEMSYFAPASFHYDPPWWLINHKPEFYENGLSSWVRTYERFLPLFLEAIELEETMQRDAQEKKTGCGASKGHSQLLAIHEEAVGTRPSEPMSKRMKRNWENSRFFVDYCARRNYGFDPIYWKFVDKTFFGKNKKSGLLLRRSDYKGRLHLLSEKERAQMEPFISWKMEDREDEKLVEWDDKDAQTVLAACLAGTLGDIVIPKPRQIPSTITDRSSSP